MFHSVLRLLLDALLLLLDPWGVALKSRAIMRVDNVCGLRDKVLGKGRYDVDAVTVLVVKMFGPSWVSTTDINITQPSFAKA